MSNGRGLLSPIDSGLSTTEKMMTLYNLKQQKADRAAQQEQQVKANKLQALSTIIPYQAGNAKIASLQEYGKTLGVEFDMTKEKEIVDLIKRIGKQKDPNVAMQLMNAELEEYVLPEWLEAQRAQAEGQLQGEIKRQATMEAGMIKETEKTDKEMAARLKGVYQEKYPEYYMQFFGKADKPKIPAGKWTPESMAEYQRTGDYKTLERERPVGRAAMKVPSPTERTKIAETRAAIDSLNNLKSLYDKNFVGPIAGRKAKAKSILGLNPLDQEEFMAATSAFKNQVIKEITGAQMSEKEAERIMKQIPDITDQPNVWLAKHRQSIENLKRINERRKEVLRQTGVVVPEETQTQVDANARYEEIRNQNPSLGEDEILDMMIDEGY